MLKRKFKKISALDTLDEFSDALTHEEPESEESLDTTDTLFASLESLINNENNDITKIASVLTQLIPLLIENEKLLKKLIEKTESILKKSDLIFKLDTKNAIALLTIYSTIHDADDIYDLFVSLYEYKEESTDTRAKINKINQIKIISGPFNSSIQAMILSHIFEAVAKKNQLEVLLQLAKLHVPDPDFILSFIMKVPGKDTFRLLMHHIENINFQDEDGATLLIHSVRSEFCTFDRLGILLEAKADPNLQDELGKTALAYAVAELDVESVKKLISSSNLDLVDKFKNSLLHQLARVKTDTKTTCERVLNIALLLKGKVNINGKNKHGYTPLMEAIKAKNTVLVDFLIKQNCDLSLLNAFGNSAHELAYLYHRDALKSLPPKTVTETERMQLEQKYGCFPEEMENINRANLCILLAQKMIRRQAKVVLPFYAYVLKYEEFERFTHAIKTLFAAGKFDKLRIFVLIETANQTSHHWRCIDFLFTKSANQQMQAKAFVLETILYWLYPNQDIVPPLFQAIPNIEISTNAETIQYDNTSCALMALDHLSQSSTLPNFHEQLVKSKSEPKEFKPKHVIEVTIPLKLLRGTQSLRAINQLITAEFEAQEQVVVNRKGNGFYESIQQRIRFGRNRRINDKFIKQADYYYQFIKENSPADVERTVAERGITGFHRLCSTLLNHRISESQSVTLFKPAKDFQKESGNLTDTRKLPPTDKSTSFNQGLFDQTDVKVAGSRA